MKNKRGAEVIHVYNPHFWMKTLLILITTFILCFHLPTVLWITLATPEFPKFIFILTIPMYAGLLWYTVIFCTQTHLIVYEDGLELQRGSSHFFANWENMSHFGRRWYGKKQNYGIFLYEPVQPEVNSHPEKLVYGWSSNYMNLDEFVHFHYRWQGLFSGMKVDTEKLLNTELGQELYHFAPHLFEYEKEKVKNQA